MLLRHGARLPSAKDIVGAQTVLQNLKYEVLLQHNMGKGKSFQERLLMLKQILKLAEIINFCFICFS